jgi:hypothetical protein
MNHLSTTIFAALKVVAVPVRADEINRIAREAHSSKLITFRIDIN